VALGIGLGVLAANPQRARAESSTSRTLSPVSGGGGTDWTPASSAHDAPARNSYGNAYGQAGHSFSAIANLDSDGDGFINDVEIAALTFPGDANDKRCGDTHPDADGHRDPTQRRRLLRLHARATAATMAP